MIGKSCAVLAIVLMQVLPVMSATCSNRIVKVPCRDMGDGRTLIDTLYVPDGVDLGKLEYTILRTRPASMEGEWANKVCTIRIK